MFSFDIVINIIPLIIGMKEILNDNKLQFKIRNIIFISLYTFVIMFLMYYLNYILGLMINILWVFLFIILKFISRKYVDIRNDCYSILDNNCKNELLLMQYKKRVHEDKNHILIIRGMLDDSKNALHEYIDSLIDDDDNLNNEMIVELCRIGNVGIKNFLRAKISKIISLNANLELYVSEDVINIKSDSSVKELNNLYTILGVLLDNVIDSISMCKTKLVSIAIYVKNGRVYFELANSYNGNIEIDKLGDGKYSTKGANHGVGLSLVKNIVLNSDKYKLESFILDDFFVQKLEIKINE